jgi:heme a synthase
VSCVLFLRGTEAAQGVIGYTQYFVRVPGALVELHMLGACLVWLATLHVLLPVHSPLAPHGPAVELPTGPTPPII